jgi:peptidyl-prolyl cis-trans isomerase A (cyclophilin A)
VGLAPACTPNSTGAGNCASHQPSNQETIMQEREKVTQTLKIFTTLGEIVIALETARAPVTCANFLRYVDGGSYRGGQFHRTVTLDNQAGSTVLIEVVQAGKHPDLPDDMFPPVSLERTCDTGLTHCNGALAMARKGPDSATSDFFICIGDQPELDFGGARNPDGQGFAVFGQVLRGMDVVQKIQQSRAEGQKLSPPIEILEIAHV